MIDYITDWYNTGHRRSNHTSKSDRVEFPNDIQWREAPSSVGECVSSGVHQYQEVNPPVYVTVGPSTIQVMLAMPIGLKQ